MNYRNSIQFLQSLSSQFTGPYIFNELTDEEKAAAEAEAKAKEEADAAEAARIVEEEAAKAALEEDPLTTPNTFEEGSPEHTAFERQREKFKDKLAKEVDAARKGAEASVAGKLDEVLIALSKTNKSSERPPEKEEKVELTGADRQIVIGVLQEMGLDPQVLAQERRRAEVNAAIAQIRKDNPGIEFDDLALVNFANESGISRMGGSPQDILELAFFRKHGAELRKGTVPKPETSLKKEAIHIVNGGTKKEPLPADDKPKDINGWKARIMNKFKGD